LVLAYFGTVAVSFKVFPIFDFSTQIILVSKRYFSLALGQHPPFAEALACCLAPFFILAAMAAASKIFFNTRPSDAAVLFFRSFESNEDQRVLFRIF